MMLILSVLLLVCCAQAYEYDPYGYKDRCHPNPCHHGGTCSLHSLGYKCICANGYCGKHCEARTDPCDDHPCVNGGTCFRKGYSYACQCKPGYGGKNCEEYSKYGY